MNADALFEAAKARFLDAVLATTPPGADAAAVTVAAFAVVDVLQFLRDEPSLRFEFLQNLTAVDWPKRSEIEVVYHLFSYAHGHEIVVKVALPRANPRVPSAASLWKNAGWLEREQFDVMGVIFEGHPDLRRLLLPDDWVGHPMRKDYVEAAAYRGMPTRRPSPLDLLASHDKRGGGTTS